MPDADSPPDLQSRRAAEMLPLVYAELRALAAARLASEAPGHTLDPTALVHEAFLRLVGPGDPACWDGRAHFFGAAARAIRRVLVDAARRKRTIKRDGGRRVELADPPIPSPDPTGERILALDGALSKLADEDPVAAAVAELRRFAGMGHEAIATELGITVYEARRKWTYARAWLRVALGE